MTLKKQKNRKHRAYLWAAIAGLILLLLPVILLSVLPLFASILPKVDLTIDLSTNLTAEASALFTNKTVTAHLSLDSAREGGVMLTSRGCVLDWPYTLKVRMDYSVFGLSGRGSFEFLLDNTAWGIRGGFVATPRTWRADVRLPETMFDAEEPLIKDILSRFPMPAVSNLVFSGKTEFEAHAEKTREIPVVAWSANGRLKELAAGALIGPTMVDIKGLSVSFGAEGIANRTTIHPAFLRIKSVDAGGLSFTSTSAAIRKTENGFMVSEAGTHFCGGEVKLYSLYLNPLSLTAGFTLFLDNIDANEIMQHVAGFNGEASGRLHGKLPLFLKNGKTIRLRDAYLYSTPGETGTLRLNDPDAVIGNLAMSGVDETTCNNLARALADLLYTVLKFDLRREDNGSLALTFHIEGTATHRGISVPVSFKVTFHGDIEELINTGLKIGVKQK